MKVLAIPWLIPYPDSNPLSDTAVRRATNWPFVSPSMVFAFYLGGSFVDPLICLSDPLFRNHELRIVILPSNFCGHCNVVKKV
jgi:hypothetical protein